MPKGSLAERLGLQPGDRLVAINGHILRDVIDYRFYGSEEELELEIERGGQRLFHHVQRRYGEDFGVRFTDDVFDGLRVCDNRCDFCFVDQMPAGMRPSLYVKDDDYRYSFLHGNFITLSNWADKDWERVAEEHLSPLYISVHATDVELRRHIFRNPRLPDIQAQLRRLADLGIEVHTQIVVLPRLNDGLALERTVRDLTEFYPAVRSIGVVPVGLTRYHSRGMRLLTADEERTILQQSMLWQAENRRRLGVALVYPSDELYLRGGFPIPSANEYDGFPQLENGIGLVRHLLDEWQRLKKESRGRAKGRGAMICGKLIAPVLGRIVEELNGKFALDISLIPVANGLFGSGVTVSGLLGGEDVVGALDGREAGEVLFLPRAMFDGRNEVTLDGWTVRDLESSLGVSVRPTSSMREIVGHFGIAG